MANLLDQLRAYLGGWARLLASANTLPAALLAGSSGAAIAALVSAPNLSSTGVGVVIGGIAINVASSLLQALVRLPPDDDDGREEIIERGLAEGDAGIQQAVAAALVAAGPELTLALSAAQREALSAKFEQGLRDLGGASERIAPGFANNLRDPSADWHALWEELQRAIAAAGVTQTAEVGDEGAIRRVKQRVDNPTGPVSQTLRGGKKAVIEDADQTVSNARPTPTLATTPGATRPCPDCGATVRADAASCPSCGLPLTNDARLARRYVAFPEL